MKTPTIPTTACESCLLGFAVVLVMRYVGAALGSVRSLLSLLPRLSSFLLWLFGQSNVDGTTFDSVMIKNER